MNYITYKNTYSKNITHIVTKSRIMYNEKNMETIALWDTGATHTHITKNIIDVLELKSSKSVSTISHGGNVLCEKYKVTIILPTNGKIKDITVLSTTNAEYMGEEIGIIIGMDIIQCGDFHIDHEDNKTVFTFRHHVEDIDDEILIETNLF